MRKISKMLIILVSLMIVMLSAPLGVLAYEETTCSLTKDKQEKIEEFVEKNMSKGKIPGLAITIVKDNETIYKKGFGYSDIEKKVKVTNDTLFELGSTSKAFTALGILKLEKEGLINLNDDVSKYISWFQTKYNGENQNITIENLLHHSSGVPFKSIDKIPISDEEDALENTVKTLVGIELESKPGEHYQYATINYDVLGLIIQKVSGVSYEEYIEKNILEPMGLDNTFLSVNESVKENIATGYKLNLLKPSKYDAPRYRGNKPAGYIMTNAEDMAKWLKIQMNTADTSNFDKSLIDESHVPNRTIKPYVDGSSYAAGWNVYQDSSKTIAHGGTNPNYSSYLLFKDETKEGVAVLSNTNSSYVDYICEGISEILDGEYLYKDVKDINKTMDIVSSFIIVISAVITIATLFLGIKLVKEIIEKKRKYKKISVRKFLLILMSLIFMAGVNYCIYLIPYILYDGVSWEFVYVWLPNSVRYALYLLLTGAWSSYLYILLNNLFKKKDDKSLPTIALLSIASGFGNALIIFTINISINSSNDLKLKLLIYFILGVVLYVYGQKVMRKKLIIMTNKIVYSKRLEIIEKALKAPYDKFEKIEKGRIQTTLNNDTETMSRFVNILIGGITGGVTLICCCMYLGFINIYALLLAVIIIIFISGIYYIASIYADKVSQSARDIQNVFLKFINDLIGGFKELSLSIIKKQEFKNDLEVSCDQYRIKRGQASLAFANMFVVGELLFTLAIGAIALIFPFVLKNLQSESIASYVFVLLYMIGPVHQILDTIPSAIDVRISSSRINELIDDLSDLNYSEPITLAKNLDDNVVLELHNVEYQYGNESDRKFKVGPINYEFKSGEIIFIAGGNGSGKSTLGKLLTGLYVPTSGDILLNNKIIESKDLGQYYTSIFADFYLFDKLYGIDCSGKESEIGRYLEILQLDKKVKIQNGKFSTTKLSTGQKKRLALLVSLLEDKPIFLFDEWAADQDPEYRAFFYKSILPDLKERGKCVIAVTHDEQYFDVADKFIKMNMGLI